MLLSKDFCAGSIQGSHEDLFAAEVLKEVRGPNVCLLLVNCSESSGEKGLCNSLPYKQIEANGARTTQPKSKLDASKLAGVVQVLLGGSRAYGACLINAPSKGKKLLAQESRIEILDFSGENFVTDYDKCR